MRRRWAVLRDGWWAVRLRAMRLASCRDRRCTHVLLWRRRAPLLLWVLLLGRGTPLLVLLGWIGRARVRWLWRRILATRVLALVLRRILLCVLSLGVAR